MTKHNFQQACRAWVLLLLITVRNSESGKSRNKSVKISLANPNEKAFTNDIRVDIIGGSRHSVVKLFYEDEPEAIAGQMLTQNIQKSVLVFDCGYFVRKGNYKFKYYTQNVSKNSLATTMLNVDWPNSTISFTGTGQLFSADSEIFLTFSGEKICKSYLMKNYRTKLVINKLSYYRDTAVFSQEYSNFPPSRPLLLRCDSLKTPGGYYALVYLVAYNSSLLLATSHIVDFQWSDRYDVIIDSNKNKLFCGSQKDFSFTMKVKKPPCAPVNDRVVVSLVNKRQLTDDIYTAQVADKKKLSFPCLNFSPEEEMPPAICITYETGIGVRKNIVRKRCFKNLKSNHSEELNIDGEWSTWTSWSTCHHPCNVTLHRRHRYCDNPKPIGVNAKNCPEDYRGNENYELREDSTKCKDEKLLNIKNDACMCGCFISSAGSSGIISSPVQGQCSNEKKIIWVLSVPPSNVVTFRVILYDISFGEYVTVSGIRYDDDRVIRNVVSFPSSPEVGYEMTSSYNQLEVTYNRDKRGESCGFILNYTVQETSSDINPPEEAALTTTSPYKKSYDETNTNLLTDDKYDTNWAVIVGVSTCFFIIIIALSVSCKRYRLQKRARKERLDRRRDCPPDGKSSSDMEEQSERRLMIQSGVDSSQGGESAGISLIPAQPGAYYLAQRQLQLMKKIGNQGATQVYEASVLQIPNIRDQEDLLFGDSLRRDQTPDDASQNETTA